MKFLKELFSNPDGTASTKRTMGWLLIISTLVLIFVFPTHQAYEYSITALLSTAVGALGLSTVDYQSFIKNESDKKI